MENCIVCGEIRFKPYKIDDLPVCGYHFKNIKSPVMFELFMIQKKRMDVLEVRIKELENKVNYDLITEE